MVKVVWFLSFLRLLFATGLSLAILFSVGCATTGYLSELAGGQLSLLSKRKAISKVLENESIDSEFREKLRLTQDLRKFILSELNLDVKKNYTTYVDTGRPWVVKALTASNKCKIEPFTWKFPIVGEVPYLGFFSEKSARRKETGLISEGYDTYVRSVQAYSTLGWFSDPVLSSFLLANIPEIVATVIHETVHMNIFKKGDMEFNENIAVFIEEEGTKIYLRRKFGEKSLHLRGYLAGLKSEKERIMYLREVIRKLKVFYSSGASCKEITEGREDLFRRFEAEYFKRFGRKISINNAFLVNIELYNVNYEELAKEYREKFRSDLREFISYYREKF